MNFEFGSGVLTGLRTDTSGTNTPQRFGALQDVAVEFSGDTKELFAMNQFPISSARGKVKITGKAKVAEIKSGMYNDLFFGSTRNTGALRYAYNESTTLGTGAASYTIANPGSTPLVDQGVFLALTGVQLDSVASSPGTNQYTFNASTGVYAFNAAQALAAVLVNYTYKVASGFTISGGNPLMGVTPRFQATLFQNFNNDQIVLVLYSCVAGRLSYPTRQDDYLIQDLDFTAFATPGGQTFDWSMPN